MKIAEVRPLVVSTPPPHRGGRTWVFVKLTTDDGICGVGEAYKVPFHPLTVARLIEDVGETYVVGQDPFQVERIWRSVYYGEGYESHDHHQHPDHTVVGVLSAIEMACWDIIGKSLNQPVYNLLGGRYHDKLRSYTYLYPAPGDTSRRSPHTDPDAARRSALAHVEQGFTALKFDPLIDVMGARDPREPPLDRWTTPKPWCERFGRRLEQGRHPDRDPWPVDNVGNDPVRASNRAVRPRSGSRNPYRRRIATRWPV